MHTTRRVANCNPITSCINTSRLSTRLLVWLLIDKQRLQSRRSLITSATDLLLIRQRKKVATSSCHIVMTACAALVVVTVVLATNVLHVMTYTRNRGKHTAPHSLAAPECWVCGGASIACVQLAVWSGASPLPLKMQECARESQKANGTGACIHCAISLHLHRLALPTMHCCFHELLPRDITKEWACIYNIYKKSTLIKHRSSLQIEIPALHFIDRCIWVKTRAIRRVCYSLK